MVPGSADTQFSTMTRFIIALLFLTIATVGYAQPERCGFSHIQQQLIQQDPHLEDVIDHAKNVVYPQISTGPRSFNVINVPVVVHIIHSGEPVGTGSNISDAQVAAQIQVMNEDFSAMDPDFGNTPAQWSGVIGDAMINFCLAEVAPNGTATNGITRHNIPVTGSSSNNNNIESTIKPQTMWDPTQYMNVYVLSIPGTTANGGVLGYAYLPYNGTIGSSNDGIVVDYNWFGGPGFNQSGDKTMTHEIGHYLGLFHTFDGESCNSDDGVTDTPNVNAPTADLGFFSCNNNFPAGPSSCGNEHMYVNYMDYSQESCYTSFTNGQIAIMRSVLEGTSTVPGFGSRTALVSNAVACNLPAVDASLVSLLSPTGVVCSGSPVSPVVELRNTGQQNLNSATITYTVGAGAPQAFSWSGNLTTGQTESVTLPAFLPATPGLYNLNVIVSNPNNTADGNASNNSVSTQIEIVDRVNLPLAENVENETGFPLAGSNIRSLNVSNDPFEWEVFLGASANGAGMTSLRFNNYDGNSGSNPNNTIDALLTETYDVAGSTDLTLSFDVAYAPYNNTFSDSLYVLLAIDCNSTYDTEIYYLGGNQLASAPATTSAFLPTASQWRNETIDLSAYNNVSSISVAFVNRSGYGNNLYLDNINLSGQGGGCALTGAVTGTDVSCFGENDGTASVVVNGGTGNYTYLWDAGTGNQTGASAVGLAAGSYSVTVSDGPTCSQIFTTSINQPTDVTLSISANNESSNGASDGVATASASGGNGGFTYQWSNGDSGATIFGLAPGNYTVTATDNTGCFEVSSIVIEGFVCGTIGGTIPDGSVSCAGDADGSLTVSPTGGSGPYQYQWSNGASGASIGGLIAGNYTVTITDSDNCPGVVMGTVVEPDLLQVSVSVTNESGSGTNDGTATANGGGGTGTLSYQWSNGASGPTIANLAPGSYTVTITDANGCTMTATGVVGGFICSGLDGNVAETDISCFGEGDGSLTALPTGGNGPYAYIWSNNQTGQTISGLQPGTYEVTVIDQDNCSTVLDGTVEQPAQLLTSANATDVSSNGAADGTATAIPMGGSGGYSFSWSNGATSQTISNLLPGTYCVTVTDGQGCTASTCTDVAGVNCSGISVSISDDALACFGDSNGSLTAQSAGTSGTVFYQWSGTDQTSATISGLSAGTYTVTITDETGCSSTASASVTQPAAISLSVSGTDESGNDTENGTATASAAGGTGTLNYLWNTGQSTATITDLAPGTYTVTVTDQNGCTTSESVVINEFFCGNITGTVSDDLVSCFGENDGSLSATVNGGNGTLNYLWSNNATTQTISGLAPGTYTVTITDGDNCSTVLTGQVGEPDQLFGTASATDVTSSNGNDGTATAMASGGTGSYSYSWDNGENTATITNLAPGTYCVTITDNNNCTTSACTTVSGINCGGIGVTVIGSSVTCFGDTDGTLSATAAGTTGTVSYEWSGTAQTGQTINNLAPGSYTVTITDENGCSAVASGTVTEPSALNLSTAATAETGNGTNDGTATASATGGTGQLTYLWSNNNTGATITGLAPGTYTVTVTDENGCSTSESVTIEGFICAGLAGTVSSTSVSCFGQNDGSLTALPTGGSGTFTYQWSNGATTQTITGLGDGSATVTATDSDGCSVVLTGTVSEPTLLTVSTSSENETFNGANDGSATATPDGGTAPYSYLWSSGDTDETADNLAPGTYSVTVTDANQCSTVGSVVISEFSCASFSGNLSMTATLCNGDNNGSLTAQPIGGSGPYQYLWSDGQTEQTAVGLFGGFYSVTVTGSDACTIILSGTVSDPEPIQLSTMAQDESAPGANDGTATAMASGGTGNFDYLWSNSETTASIGNLAPGIYTVTITDENGCTTTGQATVNAANCNLSIEATGTNVNCPGEATGSATVNPPGPAEDYTYEWSNSATTQTVSGLVPGTYTVTVTDSENCSATAEVVIIQEDDAAPAVLVQDLTVYLNASGTATISAAMANNGTSDNCPGELTTSIGTTTYNCDNIGANTNTFTAVDAAGNSVSVPFSVTVIDTLAPIVLSCPSDLTVSGCVGVNYVVDAEDNCGEVTYTLVGGLESGSVFPEGSTEVIVLVSDASGNETMCSFNVTATNTLQVESLVTQPSCAGFPDGSVQLEIEGGTPPYQVDWGNVDPDNLPPGAYTFTITDQAGCIVSGNILLEGPPLISVETGEIVGSTEGQADGSITILVSGGTPGTDGEAYSFIWRSENGTVVSTEQNPTDLPAGNYTVQVTDANGCSFTTDIIVIPLIIGTNEHVLDPFVRLYPSPTTELSSIHFDLPEAAEVDIQILDLRGKVVEQVPVRSLRRGSIELNLRDLSAAVYTVRIRIDDEFLIRRVVKL